MLQGGQLDIKPANEISRSIVDRAIEVHRTLGGPGLIESIYEEALVWELQQQGHQVERQVELPVVYKGQKLRKTLRLDLRVDQQVIVECKATTEFNEVFEAQLLTYLRLSGMKLGLILNFGETLMKNGIYRVVNGL